MACQSSRMKSSFHGTIKELPGISADNFENASKKRCRAYFLSHYHADHIVGLDSTELIHTLEKTNAIIYMSEITAKVLETFSKNAESLMKYIETLKPGSTNLLTIPGDESRNWEEMYLNVTTIPAGHCIGSVMFLFATHECTVLYTGDFKIQSSDVSKIKPLHDRDGAPIRIDAMYVDTTFFSHENLKNYPFFPKRMDSTNDTVDVIERWLQQDASNMVSLITSASIGYECLFNKIYDRLGMKTCVDGQKWELYSKLPHLVYGVTNDSGETRLHLCKRSESQCFLRHDCRFNYKRVVLSATIWSGYNVVDDDPVTSQWDTIKVCFATHNSTEEVRYFVEYFDPRKVEGFPTFYF